MVSLKTQPNPVSYFQLRRITFSTYLSNSEKLMTENYLRQFMMGILLLFGTIAMAQTTPVCSVSVTPVVGVCGTTTNTYSLTAVVDFANASQPQSISVTTGGLLITQNLPANAGQYNAVFNGLPGDGQSKNITVALSGTACAGKTVNYTAPNCTIPCSVTITPVVGPCSTTANTYSLTAVVSLSNPSQAQSISITTNGLTSIANLAANTNLIRSRFSSLPGDGQSYPITVMFSGSTCPATTVNYAAPLCTAVPPPSCSVSVSNQVGACNPATNTYSLTSTVSFANATQPQTISITTGGQTITQNLPANIGSFVATFAGLPSNGASQNVQVVLSGTTCAGTTSSYMAPASCAVAVPCSATITPIVGPCNTASNSYSLSGSVQIDDGPSSGTMIIATQGLPLQYLLTTANGTYTFGFTGLNSTGQTYPLTVNFSTGSCTVAAGSYTAPASCSVAPVCSTSLAITAGSCASATNTYSITALVSFANASQPQTISVTTGGLIITQNLPANTGAFAAVFSGLPSNGQQQAVNVALSGTTCTGTTGNYMAPASCSVAQPCSTTLTVLPGLCSSAANNYSLTASVQVSNGPTSGTLSVTTQGLTANSVVTFDNGTYNFSFLNLAANGQNYPITATFSAGNCTVAAGNYVAPASCSVAQPCSTTLTITPGLCSSATNSYSLTASVKVANGPTSGTLSVTTQGSTANSVVTFANGTYNFNFLGLTANGQNYPLTATFSTGSCTVTAGNYMAPASCSATVPPTPTCPNITTLTIAGSGTLCNKQCTFFTATLSTTASTPVRFVYFTSPQVGTAAYTGGTTIASITAINGTASPQFIEGYPFPTNTGTTPVVYYVYAILDNPTSTTCRPVAGGTVTVLPDPVVSVVTPAICAGSSTRSVSFSIGSGSTYRIEFVGGFSLVPCGLFTPFNITHSYTTVAGGSLYAVSLPASLTSAVLVTNETTGCQSIATVNPASTTPRPDFTLSAQPVSCSGTATQPNGQLIISNVANGSTYQYSFGSSFNTGVTGPTIVPGANFVIGNLTNPATAAGQPYTVRISAGIADCFTDQTVTLPYQSCGCPAPKCVPMTIQRLTVKP
jgi:hypothetical protein